MAKKMYSFENFDIDVNNGSLEILLWSVYAGIIVGVGSSLLYRVCTHSFVDAVIKAGALDEDHAVTVDSLDFRGKWYIKRQLRAGNANSLSRMFVCTNADTFPKKKYGPIRRFWREKFLGDEIPTEIPFETLPPRRTARRRVTPLHQGKSASAHLPPLRRHPRRCHRRGPRRRPRAHADARQPHDPAHSPGERFIKWGFPGELFRKKVSPGNSPL